MYFSSALNTLCLYGGEGGIRTPDTLLRCTPLAGERLRPLGHLSVTGTNHTVFFCFCKAVFILFPVSVLVRIFLVLNALVNLFTVYSNVFWCVYANTYLVAFYTQYSHRNIVPNHQGFTYTSSQNQHSISP